VHALAYAHVLAYADPMDHRGPGSDATFEQRLEAWALTDLQWHWG